MPNTLFTVRRDSGLSKTPHYFLSIHREAIEIFKHTNNFNKKEESLKVAWLPALENLKIQNSNSHLERENSSRSTTGHRPHNNKSGSDYHARDDITSAVYNDINREHSVDSEQQPRSQVSNDAVHRSRQHISEKNY